MNVKNISFAVFLVRSKSNLYDCWQDPETEPHHAHRRARLRQHAGAARAVSTQVTYNFTLNKASLFRSSTEKHLLASAKSNALENLWLYISIHKKFQTLYLFFQ